MKKRISRNQRSSLRRKRKGRQVGRTTTCSACGYPAPCGQNHALDLYSKTDPPLIGSSGWQAWQRRRVVADYAGEQLDRMREEALEELIRLGYPTQPTALSEILVGQAPRNEREKKAGRRALHMCSVLVCLPLVRKALRDGDAYAAVRHMMTVVSEGLSPDAAIGRMQRRSGGHRTAAQRLTYERARAEAHAYMKRQPTASARQLAGHLHAQGFGGVEGLRKKYASLTKRKRKSG